MAWPVEAELVTDAEVDALGLMPEYFAKVPADVRAAKRIAAIGYVLSFLGKRARRPVAEIGPELKEAIAIRAYCTSVRYIGYPPGDGADEQFEKAEKANEAYLDLVRKGDVEPYFVDSSPTVAEFGPLGGTSKTSDAWVTRNDPSSLYTMGCRRRC
jgi:hypothetical protein